VTRRPGRPRCDPSDPDPSVKVSVTVPARGYDRLYRLAVADRVSIPEFIRRSLSETLRNRNSRLPDPDR